MTARSFHAIHKSPGSAVFAGVRELRGSARLAHAIAEAAAAEGPIANLPDRGLAAVASRLKRWRVTPTESEGWAKAEVTVGGVDTAGLSSKTMEARNVPGLYIIGEAVDVTGWLGGYNFQWAWSSGWCAGQASEQRR